MTIAFCLTEVCGPTGESDGLSTVVRTFDAVSSVGEVTEDVGFCWITAASFVLSSPIDPAGVSLGVSRGSTVRGTTETATGGSVCRVGTDEVLLGLVVSLVVLVLPVSVLLPVVVSVSVVPVPVDSDFVVSTTDVVERVDLVGVGKAETA